MEDVIRWTPPADYQPPTPTAEPKEVTIVKTVRVADPDHGWRNEDREITVKLSTEVDGFALMELYATLGGKGGNREYADAFLDAFEQVLHPGDPATGTPSEYKRFRAWTAEVRPPVQEAQAWFWDILGRLSDRPTGGPSNSSDGPTTTDPGSTAGGEPTPATTANGSATAL